MPSTQGKQLHVVAVEQRLAVVHRARSNRKTRRSYFRCNIVQTVEEWKFLLEFFGAVPVPSNLTRIQVKMLYARTAHYPHEYDALHRFFSPSVVPEGLSRVQVIEIVALAPLREWHKAQWSSLSIDSTAFGRPLPDEFRHVRQINRTRFRRGINKLKADIISLLGSDLSGLRHGRDVKVDLVQYCDRFVFPTLGRSIRCALKARLKRGVKSPAPL